MDDFELAGFSEEECEVMRKISIDYAISTDVLINVCMKFKKESMERFRKDAAKKKLDEMRSNPIPGRYI